jgi:hypothetical protein
MVQWLLQSNHPNLTAIRDIECILREQGHAVHMVSLKARSTELPDLGMLDKVIPTICYGPSFVPRAFGCADLDPGIFFDPTTFCWSAFQSGWRGLMLSEGQVVPASEVADLVGNKRVFARPDEDSKAFDGGLFDSQSMAETITHAMSRNLIQPDSLVVMADPVPVEAEWRTFVVGTRVVAASSYRKDGIGDLNLHVPYAVVDLAFEASALWTPAEVFCLDIAQSEGRYKIVEANCFNAARFYAADAATILAEVSSWVMNDVG